MSGIDFKELSRRVREKTGYGVELISAAGEGSETARAGAQRAIITQSPLDMLFKRAVINDRQYFAGDTLRALHETVHQSGITIPSYDGMAVTDITFGPKPGLSDKIVESCRELTRIISSLTDPVRLPLLIVCCYQESISVAYSVPNRGRAHDAAVAKFTLSLELLAEIV